MQKINPINKASKRAAAAATTITRKNNNDLINIYQMMDRWKNRHGKVVKFKFHENL